MPLSVASLRHTGVTFTGIVMPVVGECLVEDLSIGLPSFHDDESDHLYGNKAPVRSLCE